MKIKKEQIKLVVDGKTIERGTLTKKEPWLVWFTEHSSITDELRKGKTKDQAETEYLARAARSFLQAALDVLDKLTVRDKSAAQDIHKAFFFKPAVRQVTYEDGEPVNLEDYEETGTL